MWDVNVPSAINQCLDMGYAESDIIIDVIICGYTYAHGFDDSKSAFKNFMNAKTERDFYSNSNSIQSSLAAFPDVEKRYYF